MRSKLLITVAAMMLAGTVAAPAQVQPGGHPPEAAPEGADGGQQKQGSQFNQGTRDQRGPGATTGQGSPPGTMGPEGQRGPGGESLQPGGRAPDLAPEGRDR
ncbi:MAG: hypothetical protein QOI12_536 [Alphaproteobacteria bacterium]|jgi:hypothetical protein|nr:hypothetical protein [Alphaproteobacteria bacterium]